MMRLMVTLLLLAMTGLCVAQEPKLVAESEPLTPEQQRELFHLPAGFEIELVASEPSIQKPINLNFDAKGQLWVTQSVEYPFPADPEKTTPRDSLRILDDTNGDGVPDRVRVFADGLNIPIGVTPLSDGAACYSIPNIYKMSDKDGDGRAEQRVPLYTEFGFQDTHGMASSFRWWIDGWVYACHGFFNTSTVKGADGHAITMNSGNTYRFRTDGSHIEQFTHGQVNPFGLAFDPLGNLYSSDCHSKPVYMLLRGAWYPSFGKPHDGLGFGPEMIEHLHGSTGICGIVYYAADQFPAEFRDTIFIGNPVTGRINHDRLQQFGSTYRAIEQPDFLSCDDPWFRPVDIALAPDGSLYIADFYNRIIGHYEVPLDHPGRDRQRGRIWRIVYKGNDNNAAAAAPDLTALDCQQLIDQLATENLTVRTLATHQLAERIGPQAVEPLTELHSRQSHVWQRVHGLWVLFRLGALTDDLVTRLAADSEAAVRVHLAKCLAERPDWRSDGFERNCVLGLIEDEDAFVRRAAAEALGRHPDPNNVTVLLDLWEKTTAEDTHLIHVTRMALRDTLASHPQLGTLVTSYSEQPGRLARIADVALGIPAPAASQFLLDYLRLKTDKSRLSDWLYHTARHADDELLPAVYEYAESLRSEGTAVELTVLRSLHRAAQERQRALPANIRQWAVTLGNDQLRSKELSESQQALDFVRELGLAETAETVATLVAKTSPHAPFRHRAVEVYAAIAPDRARTVLAGIVADFSEPTGIRQKAAEVVGTIQDESVRATLLAVLTLAPRGLDVSIARGLVRTDAGGDALVKIIEQGKATRQLLQDGVVAYELYFRQFDRKLERLEVLLKDLPAENERIQSLIAERQSAFESSQPDVTLGAEVFEKNCSACHQLEGKGGKVGPQLDGIGVRGLSRILEDILDPNRNVDQNFRSTMLELADGQVLSGLVLREEGAVVVVANSEGKEIRISKQDIVSRKQTTLSPMPADVAEKLPVDQLNHLLAFLLSHKEQPTQ